MSIIKVLLNNKEIHVHSLNQPVEEHSPTHLKGKEWPGATPYSVP